MTLLNSSDRKVRASLAVCILVLMVAWLSTETTSAQNDPDKKEWIQLFNGRDLQGWDIKITGYELNENFGNTFRVEDGVLKVAYDKYDRFDSRFGLIFYREPFSYYLLGVEYRFVGEQTVGAPDWALRNSGVMIHSQSGASMTKNQNFPISIEVQFLGGIGDKPRPTANLCTPGTHVVMNGGLFTEHCVSSTAPTFSGDQWVRVEVMALGGETIRHIVGGKTVIEYSKPQIGGDAVQGFDPAVKKEGAILTGGYIALQAESHPIEFRKVELLQLEGCMDPNASNYKSYYRKANNAACRYDRKTTSR